MHNWWIYVTLPESKEMLLIPSWPEWKYISDVILKQLKKIFVSKAVGKQCIFAVLHATTFHEHLHYFYVSLLMHQQDCDFSSREVKLEFEI